MFIVPNPIRFSLFAVNLGLVVIIVACNVLAEDFKVSAEVNTDVQMNDTGDEFIEGLHYSNERFMRLYESLPRDQGNKVDWEKANAEGLISPLASIDENDAEEKIFDLSVVIKFSDMLVKDVVFSHEVHTFWIDCKSCHPKLFLPQIAANRMTMTEIKEGKYCGKCHGMVAFPTEPASLAVSNFRAVCKRCHREKRR